MKILSKQLPKHPHQHYIWDSPYFYVVWISASTYPTTKDFVQTFFWEKVWIQNTLPTYGLDMWQGRQMGVYSNMKVYDVYDDDEAVLVVDLKEFSLFEVIPNESLD